VSAEESTVGLRPEESVELREMLEFLCDWLTDRRVAASYHQFTFGRLTVDELRADLARFAFLLGGGSYLIDDDLDAVSTDPRTPRQPAATLLR
jgi:hypothetical protein